MIRHVKSLLILSFIAAFAYIGYTYWLDSSISEQSTEEQREEIKEAALKKVRSEYYFRLLRDPATNSIPKNIRARELDFAARQPTIQQLNQRLKAKNPHFQAADFNWELAGPFDVGGRTRALGIDQRNPDIIISGAVSGGIWKSTDGGSHWELRTESAQNMSVSSLVQDPRQGNQDTWYYVAGEFDGNSAGAQGAFYFGSGVYKSTDNGDSWNQIAGSSTINTSYNSKFDVISRVEVNPTTGSVFICSNGYGVYRSTNGGTTFSLNPVVGTAPLTPNDPPSQKYCDIDAASNGTLVAVLSTENFGTTPNQTGVWVSTNDGANWTDVTPAAFPAKHGRSVVSFAPSDPDVFYVFTQKLNDTSNQGVSLFRFDLGDGTVSPDRGQNIPDFRTSNGTGSGYMELQGGYNMVISVKPDDPDFVLVGGTNLFRSRDGFATRPSGGYDGNNTGQKNEYWVGGYNKDNTFAQYPNHHTDQHLVVYNPNNPNQLFSTHDGGLSYTTDITATPVNWQDRNLGYITTQFYSSALSQTASDTRLLGGTQDNGSVFFRTDLNGSVDISRGDGGYSYITDPYIFVSQQDGRVIRYDTDGGNPVGNSFTFVYPGFAQGQLFINPYTVDPNNSSVMYYAAGDSLLRNTQIGQIPTAGNQDGTGTSTGWESNIPTLPEGWQVSAMAVSNKPGDILYYAGSANDNAPVIMRLDNASTSTSPTDVSIPSVVNGAYVHDIAINPINADEVLAVMSNYNITGLYHTIDGGQSWQAVEGSLTGTIANPGPSLRSAVIIPAKSGTVYLLATSTGLYSTQVLDGNNTVWGQESPADGNPQTSEVGFSVVEHLAARNTDGTIAAGTHGRGIFMGHFSGETNFPAIVLSPPQAASREEISIKAVNFSFDTDASGNTVTFNGKKARITSAQANSLKVIVPPGLTEANSSTNKVTVIASANNIQAAPATLTLLPPQGFELYQNYPNPFNPTTVIPFDLPVKSTVTITIFDLLGQRVYRPVMQQSYEAGSYTQQVELTTMASGVYLYRIVAKPESGGKPVIKIKKMTYLK